MADLLLACKNGYLTKVNELLEEGHSLKFRDHDNATALYWAACRGYWKICLALIAAGAEIEARVKWGSTSLHAAADRGHTECMKVLIKSGAEINAQNLRGDSPLHLAAYRGHTEIVEILIRARSNPFLLNEKNKTPAQEAKGQNFVRITEILQQYMEGKQLPGFTPYISECFGTQHKSLARSTSDSVRRDSLTQSDDSNIYFPTASAKGDDSKISNLECSTENISDSGPESGYYREITDKLGTTLHDADRDTYQYHNLSKVKSYDESDSEKPVIRKSRVDKLKSEEPRSPLSWDGSSRTHTALHGAKQNGRVLSSSEHPSSSFNIQVKKVKRLSSPVTFAEGFDTDTLAERTFNPVLATYAEVEGQSTTGRLKSDAPDPEKTSLKQKYIDMCNYADNLQMMLLAANEKVESLKSQLLQPECASDVNKNLVTQVPSCDDNLAYEISILKAKLNEETRLRNHYEIRCECLMDENSRLRGSKSGDSASRLLPRGGRHNVFIKSENTPRNVDNIHTRSPDIAASNCDTSPYGIRQRLKCITDSKHTPSLYKKDETNSNINSNIISYDKSDLLGIKDTYYPDSHDLKTRPVSKFDDKSFVAPRFLALENPFTFAGSLMLRKSDNMANGNDERMSTPTKTKLLSSLDTGVMYDGISEIMSDFSDFNKYTNAIF